jgi:hypothetical protein
VGADFERHTAVVAVSQLDAVEQFFKPLVCLELSLPERGPEFAVVNDDEAHAVARLAQVAREV